LPRWWCKMPQRPEFSRDTREVRKTHFTSGFEIQRIPPKAIQTRISPRAVAPFSAPLSPLAASFLSRISEILGSEAPHQICYLYTQCISDDLKRLNGYIALAAFDLAHVSAIERAIVPAQQPPQCGCSRAPASNQPNRTPGPSGVLSNVG
jgi:hypothetical protein